MNTKAMFSLSYGLFVLSTRLGDKDNACIINTAIQVASNPDRIAIAVNKQNYTSEVLGKTNDFTLSVLSEEADFALFKQFGFVSGRDTDKFADFADVKRMENGTLAITRGTNAYLCAHVEERIELGSHTLFVAALTDGDVLSSVPSATYAYYHSHIKPQPAQAASGKTAWRCSVCGYIYEGDELPADYVCPLCKHGADAFEKVQAAAPTEEMRWACEHEVGITAGVPTEILEGLRANFTGECSEVGMYLAMSRVAFREGYPEIGLYWEKAAHEEAEHAAKFAEMLGEVVTPSTEKNLAMRVAAENGATAGKLELAKMAKAANLDAIHDTVHEMARDEARHGKAFAGLLKRYFGK